jgi:hypothetical protein
VLKNDDTNKIYNIAVIAIVLSVIALLVSLISFITIGSRINQQMMNVSHTYLI